LAGSEAESGRLGGIARLTVAPARLRFVLRPAQSQRIGS
jgi:hypothetical protein